MPARQLPVSPDVHHVKREAKYLLRALRAGDPTALADFREFHSGELDAAHAKLSDAQLVLARSYGATSFPQLIAAVEFIRACWSGHGNRVRDAVRAHADLLTDYFKTPHDGWREDLAAAARQGAAVALTAMREGNALIADVSQRQAHMGEWVSILPVLHTLGNPFLRPPVPTPAPRMPRSLAEVQADVRRVAERVEEAIKPESEERRLRMEKLMRERAQDPSRVDRTFERMRAHNVQFPAASAPSIELRRKMELMNECLQLYIQSHPLP